MVYLQQYTFARVCPYIAHFRQHALLVAKGNCCYLMTLVLKGCFVSDLMKVAQLTEAKKNEATSTDLCSGNCVMLVWL